MQHSPDIGARLAKMVPRLASNQAGEVVATVAAISRTLESVGLDLHDLAQMIAAGLRAKTQPTSHAPSRRGPPPPPPEQYRGPQTPWQAAALEVLRVGLKRLSPEENRFLTTIMHWRGEPTAAQQRWLNSLCRRYGVEIENG